MDNFPVCTHCGFTFGEYRARGLLGCPHCYAGFGEALQGDIAWLHQALALTADTGSESTEPPVVPHIDVPFAGPIAAASRPAGTDPGGIESTESSAEAAAGRPLEVSSPGKPDAETLARWREQIAAAVRVENYEEAARLNKLLRSFGSMGSGPGLGLA